MLFKLVTGIEFEGITVYETAADVQLEDGLQEYLNQVRHLVNAMTRLEKSLHFKVKICL